MKRALVALALPLLAALPGSPSAADPGTPPLCRVELRVEPTRGFVGQQLLYELRIVHRRDVERMDWEEPLTFASFRAEWLPGGAGDAPTRPDEEALEVTIERRALFPARAGTLQVPAARLRCSTAASSQELRVAGARVPVEEPPAKGRPADWYGLLGPVEVHAYLKPARIALGASARLVLTLEGAHNLWLVRDPLGDALGGEAVDVFPAAPETSRDVGRTLRWRRYIRYDLVPHLAGELRVPSLALPYFDPKRGVYERARTSPLSLVVTEAPSGNAGPPLPPSRKPGASTLRGRRRLRGPAVAAGLAVAGALVLLGLRRRRRRAGNAPGSPAAAVRTALVEARDAAGRSDAAAACGALARGLRAALGPAVAGAAALSAEELRERAPDAEARGLAELLARVERLRFAPGLSEAELRALLAEVEALLPPA